MLSKAGVKRETMVERGWRSPDAARAERRPRTSSSTAGTTPLTDGCRSSRPAKRVALFDPMTRHVRHRRQPRSWRGAMEVYLQIDPGESVMLKTFAVDVRASANTPTRSQRGQPQPAGGTWTVTFTRGGPELPPAGQTQIPWSWTSCDGEASRPSRAPATYATTFDRPPRGPRRRLAARPRPRRGKRRAAHQRQGRRDADRTAVQAANPAGLAPRIATRSRSRYPTSRPTASSTWIAGACGGSVSTT